MELKQTTAHEQVSQLARELMLTLAHAEPNQSAQAIAKKAWAMSAAFYKEQGKQ